MVFLPVLAPPRENMLIVSLLLVNLHSLSVLMPSEEQDTLVRVSHADTVFCIDFCCTLDRVLH